MFIKGMTSWRASYLHHVNSSPLGETSQLFITLFFLYSFITWKMLTGTLGFKWSKTSGADCASVVKCIWHSRWTRGLLPLWPRGRRYFWLNGALFSVLVKKCLMVSNACGWSLRPTPQYCVHHWLNSLVSYVYSFFLEFPLSIYFLF